MPKTRYRALEQVDPEAVAAFAQGVRRRTTDEQILRELQACAERLGRSPTMRELKAVWPLFSHASACIAR